MQYKRCKEVKEEIFSWQGTTFISQGIAVGFILDWLDAEVEV